ncbi:hypothetical protein QOZ80_2AG0125400 [Eleusine coracana subsp. coracana]|nr:hypothetical protein QOZ80_2AG0125400 [Eleusine coracana subsp. coracana]
MGDSVAPACVKVIPDTAFQIHRMKRSAYTAVLRSFCSQSDLLSGVKEECLAQLRKELKILETEHEEYLVEAKSNKHMKPLSASMSEGSTCTNEVMKDTPDLGSTVPDGDTVFQIHCSERSAYASVLRAFGAVTNHLSWLQVKLLAKLRSELRVSYIEHKEVVAKVISDEHIKSLRKFYMANHSVRMKMDAAFHAQAVVRDKITSMEQLSTSSTNCLSLAQKSPIPERSMPSIRDNGILDSSSGAKEHLSTSSTSYLSLAQKPPIPERSMPSIRGNDVLDSSSGAKEKLSTSSTSYLSLAQKSPIPERSMPSIRDNGILDSSSGAKEESCFESHVADRLRSACEFAVAFLKLLPSVQQLPEASCTNDILDVEALSCEVKAGCTISPISQEKHSQSNAGQVPSCVDDHGRQGSRKRKTEVPVMRGSKSQCVDGTNGIGYTKHRNKDSNVEHGSEKIRLTANLLNKVEKLFKEGNRDPANLDTAKANLDTAKSMLKAHEKDLLGALARLSVVSKQEASNGQLAKVINRDEMPPRWVRSTDKSKTPPTPLLSSRRRRRWRRSCTPPCPRSETTTTSPSANSTVILLAPPQMETLLHTAVSPPSAPAVLTQKRRADAPPRSPGKKKQPRVKNKYTAEQEQWRLELAHRIGSAAPKTTDGSVAVEAFCAQVGISRCTFLK